MITGELKADAMNDALSHDMFRGERARLRAIEPEDWQALRDGEIVDTEIARLSRVSVLPRSARATRQWAEQLSLAEATGDERLFIVETPEAEVAGSITTADCDRRNGTFRYGIAIFREFWRQGYGSDAIKIALRYYFGELRYQKANASVYSFNDASVALHEHLGFRHEGRVRRSLYTSGTYHDELLYGITVEEFAVQFPEFAPRLD
jgi:RimJ/RimL family protein N-acetyltransferase